MNNSNEQSSFINEIIAGKNRIDLLESLERKHIVISNLKRFREETDLEINAYYITTLIRYDHYFIHYGYVYENLFFGFAWETYWDEWARLATSSDREWYDDIRDGDSFKVLINSKYPIQHVVIDEKFAPINNGIMYLGAWSRESDIPYLGPKYAGNKKPDIDDYIKRFFELLVEIPLNIVSGAFQKIGTFMKK